MAFDEVIVDEWNLHGQIIGRLPADREPVILYVGNAELIDVKNAFVGFQGLARGAAFR